MPEARPALLLVTRNLPPLWGGMERLNWHLARELTARYRVHAVSIAGAAAQAPAGVALREVPGKPLWRFLLAALWRARGDAKHLRPRWVLAGSGLTAPIAWWAARRSGARAAVYVHGLDLAVPHVLYRALWFPALRRMEVVIANSHATAALAARIGVPASRIHIVHPGVELPVPDPGARARFRTRYGLGEAPVLLSVGRLSTRKGLREFVSEVMPALVACHPALQLVVIGDAPHDALRAQAQTPESIRAEARRLGLEGNLRFLGPRFGVELADAYAGADVHVFPIRHLPDDPEGFGMVAVEASAHGLPTVAYATGGVVDAVQEGVSGRLVPAGDAGAFTAAVLDLLERPFDGAATRAFAADFAWPAFGAKVTQVLDDTVQAGPT